MNGALNYHAGASAEKQVAEVYARAGRRVVAARWRGRNGGEIDLIAQSATGVHFVEVKRGRDHGVAAERLGRRQMDRIGRSAEEYLSRNAVCRELEAHFDVALVDQFGRIEILPDAMAFA